MDLEFYQALQLSNTVLLHIESSTNILGNPSFVTDTHKTKDDLELLTNCGLLKTKLKAAVSGFGLVWFGSDSLASDVVIAKMEEEYCMTYDSAKE